MQKNNYDKQKSEAVQTIWNWNMRHAMPCRAVCVMQLHLERQTRSDMFFLPNLQTISSR